MMASAAEGRHRAFCQYSSPRFAGLWGIELQSLSQCAAEAFRKHFAGKGKRQYRIPTGDGQLCLEGGAAGGCPPQGSYHKPVRDSKQSPIETIRPGLPLIKKN